MLRVPKLFNLRTDPYERADTTSNTYWDWVMDHTFLAVPHSGFLATFQEFPAPPEGGQLHRRPGHGQAAGRHRQETTMSTRPWLAGEAVPLVDTQPAASDSPPAPGMVWIPGGSFLMGSDHHYPEEAPAHRVTVDGFWIDRHTVTNAEFARFVRKTGHVTVAERAPDPADYPGARPESLVAGLGGVPQPRATGSTWATTTTGGPTCPGPTGATPRGRAARSRRSPTTRWSTSPGTTSQAYAAWAGKRAADRGRVGVRRRGGLEGAEFAWGDELNPDGRWMANTWQGEFPVENLELDGYAGTAPVGRSRPTATACST